VIYHFLPGEIYTAQFINFMRINKSCLINEHLFLLLYNNHTEMSFFDARDCKYTLSFFDILKKIFLLKKNDRIILHSYSHPYLYLALVLCWWNLHKTTWHIWGGDLYWHNELKTGKYKIYELFRRFTIKRFGYVSSDRFEYTLTKQYYATSAKNIFAYYPRFFFDVVQNVRHDYISIIIGNSRDPSNEHIEALKLISKYKNENIKIYVILSYGDCPAGYVDNINRIGKAYFGDKYIPITEMMDLKTYQQFLSNVDIMVCNHRRQQAWGNLLAMLKYGKKVFIRSGISTEEDFNGYGLRFFLTDNIEKMSFIDFQAFSEEDKYMNKTIITRMFSDNVVLSVWNNLFKIITG